MAAFGLRRDDTEDAAEEPFRVYAINWPTLTVFWATWNQWEKIVSGANIIRDGIDWTQVEAALKLSGIKRGQWPLIFDGLRALEAEALKILGEQNNV